MIKKLLTASLFILFVANSSWAEVSRIGAPSSVVRFSPSSSVSRVSTPAVIAPDSLFAWYRADIGSSAVTKQAVNFDNAAGERLFRADNADLSIGSGESFHMAGWAIADATIATQALVSKWNAGAASREYEVFIAAANNLQLQVSDNGTDAPSESVNSASNISDATWFFYECGYDAATDEIFISINGETLATTSHSTGVHDGSAEFTLGGRTGSGNRIDGAMQQVGFWKFASGASKTRLTADERSYLYNSGTGRAFEDLGLAGTDGADLTDSTLKGYWELDEFSNGSGAVTRADSTSNSYDLTDNVTSDSRLGHIGSQPGNGDPIQQWSDVSGNGNHLVQNTPANMPTYATSLLNGKQGLSFDGTDDFVNVSFSSQSQPNTIFIVSKSDSILSTRVMFDGNTVNTQRHAHTTTDWQMFAGSTLTGGTPDTSAHIHSVLFNTTASRLYVDGATIISSSNVGSSAMNGITMGSRGGGDSLYWLGDIHELAIFNTLLDDVQINKLNRYYSNQYAISVSQI